MGIINNLHGDLGENICEKYYWEALFLIIENKMIYVCIVYFTTLIAL